MQSSLKTWPFVMRTPIYGVRSGHFESIDVYSRAINQCAEQMFVEIGTSHGIAWSDVLASLGKNRARIDLAINLPFVLFYTWAAYWTVGRIWMHYPPSDGWMTGAVIILLSSFVFGIGGVLVGEQWSGIAESLRIGTGHLSIRVERLPWIRFRGHLFGAIIALFLLIAAVTGWRRRPANDLTVVDMD